MDERGNGMKAVYVAHYNPDIKRIQSVEEHLINTADIAGEITGRIGCGEIGKLVGVLHDLGKYTDLFNQYIQSETGLIKSDDDDFFKIQGNQKIDHASAGAQKVYEILGKNSMSAIVSLMVIKSHHGGLRDFYTNDGDSEINRVLEKTESDVRTEEAWKNFLSNEDLCKYINQIDKDAVEIEFRNLIRKIFTDDVKNDEKLRKMAYFKLGLLVKYIYSALIEGDRQDTADFQDVKRVEVKEKRKAFSWEEAIVTYEDKIAGLERDSKINQIRSEISTTCLKKASGDRGLYRLQVPTGGGKTLSALRFALHHANKHNLERIIMVVPYTTIIDQNADVYRDIFEEKVDGKWSLNMILEHHANLTDDEKSELSRLLSENWDVPIVITTMVQFMESVYGGGTSGIRRMQSMAKSVLIFDEVQLLPPKLMVLFNGLIDFLIEICGSSVLMCTATQPLLDRLPEPNSRYSLKIDSKNDIIQDSQSLYERLKRVQVEDCRRQSGWLMDEIRDFILEKQETYGSTLVVVNTKKAANELFEFLNEIDDLQVFYLSTNMCPAHRRNVLSTMREMLDHTNDSCDNDCRSKVICISTQLIEAGVDVDFDVGIRFLAGMDSIVQAAGRVNRNGKQKMGRMYIINAIEDGVQWLPHIRRGIEASNRLLDEYQRDEKRFGNDILSVAAMNTYYTYYYEAVKQGMQYTLSETNKDYKGCRLFDLYGINEWQRRKNSRTSTKSNNFAMSFKTAGNAFSVIDGVQIGVIVPYDEGKTIISELLSEVARYRFFEVKSVLQQYMITVYKNMLVQLVEQGIVHSLEIHLANSNDQVQLFYLNEDYYDSDLGYVEEATSNIFLV